MKAILFLGFATIASFAQAKNIGKILQIDPSSGVALVEASEDIEAGSRLVVTFDDKTQCHLPVTSMNGKMVTVGLAPCERASEIKVGQKVERSLIALPPPEEKLQLGDERDRSVRRKKEDWYFHIALGFSSVEYRGETKSLVDQLDAAPNVDHASIGMDLFGFYWPVNDHRTMVGVNMNGTGSTWDGSEGDLTVNQYLLAFSAHHFLSRNIGDGWFIRGDIGLAWYRSELKSVDLSFEETSDKGFGYLAGAGYAIATTYDTSITFSVLYAYRDAEDETQKTLSLMAGILF